MRIQILNGRIYYSPNSARTVEEPSVHVPTENPFVPPPSVTKYGIKRNLMELDVATYIKPRWWSPAWGWIAFMPHEPDYNTPPFSPLIQIPRRPSRLPDSGRYEMPHYLIECWSQLEVDLTVATYLLQVHYDTPAIRPLYPLAFGYRKSHSYEGAAMKAIHKSKQWFSVWLGLFSYMIAMAETKQNELHDYSYLSKKGWADYLLEQGAQITWLESVINSMVFRFDANVIRSGVFVHLSAQSSLQPSATWFCTYHVPVWYPWGPEQASNPYFLEFAPPTDLLQSSTTSIARSPSQLDQISSEVTTSQDAVASNMSQSNATETQAVSSDVYQKDRFLASWDCFLSSRKLLRQRIEQAETSTDKQKRLARENQPPTKSAKVFHWVKDISSDGYVRVQVSKRWRQHTLGEYSSKQVRYDSYLNEWDCSSELGSDDEGDDHDDGESLEEEIPFEDYDQMNVESLAPQITSIGSDIHLDPVCDTEEQPPLFHQPQDAPFCPSIDGLEEEILGEAHIFFGYISPLPPPTLPDIINEQQQKHIMRFLGFSWIKSFSELFFRPRFLSLVKFIDEMSAPREVHISTDVWDVNRENRASVIFMERFKCIFEISGPKGQLFMFNFQERSTVKWNLTVTTATHALLVCRLHPDFEENDIALYLLRRGIPFYTLQDSTTLHPIPSVKEKPMQRPVRPVGHEFTLLDYTAYLNQCRALMQQKRLRAALLRGGYLWRVALSAMYFDAVLDGPSGLSSCEDDMFSVTLPNGKQYVDDELTEAETAVLLGTYVCRTGYGDQVALKSWCPSLSNYAKSGLDYGKWTEFNESLYHISSSDSISRNPVLKRQPCPSNQWRNICRGSRGVSRGTHRLEQASLSLIREYRSS